MMSKFYSFLLLGLLCNTSFAQNKDSLTFVRTNWSMKRLAPKVKLYINHFKGLSLFGANENISYIEVKNTGRRAVFALAADSTRLITIQDFAIGNNAIAAINGNFFDVKNGGSVDFTKVNGQIINVNRIEKERAKHQRTAIIISNDKLQLKTWDGLTDWETNLPEENVMLNGPLLLSGGYRETLDSSSFTRSRHPRTCVGIKSNGKVIMLTADGRNSNSAGLSLSELANIMKWLGCETAVNFDGGGSTTLYAKNFGDNGIVNYPTDNKKWDHAGQRKVANILLVKKK